MDDTQRFAPKGAPKVIENVEGYRHLAPSGAKTTGVLRRSGGESRELAVTRA